MCCCEDYNTLLNWILTVVAFLLTLLVAVVCCLFLFNMPGAAKIVCGVCSENVGKSGSIKCIICSHWVHASCAQLSDKELLAMKAIKVAAFVCSSCGDKLANPGSVADDIRQLNKKFDNFITTNQAEQNAIKSALDNIKAEMVSCLNGMKEDIVSCNNRIDDVDSRTSLKMKSLEAENNILHRRLNRADFIIGGLPEHLNDLIAVVVALGEFFKIPITANDIHHVCYMHNRKAVLVKFNCVLIRDKVMKEYFRTRSLKVSDILKGDGGDINARIYLNDHYSPAAAKLYTICKSMVRKQIVTKFKILNADKLRAKLLLSDGKEVIYDTERCILLLHDAASLN